jgi:predicted MFS family arabinose efflux permease
MVKSLNVRVYDIGVGVGAVVGTDVTVEAGLEEEHETENTHAIANITARTAG